MAPLCTQCQKEGGDGAVRHLRFTVLSRESHHKNKIKLVGIKKGGQVGKVTRGRNETSRVVSEVRKKVERRAALGGWGPDRLKDRTERNGSLSAVTITRSKAHTKKRVISQCYL